eukprot:TRINITY_DN2487_c3_g1_i2.p2 TRINITY_DN2487_c3_g1~~TRINITY_DN2487_c3_g1_i2.p2  ORF type:complete len:121 (-),score=6.63 TRINITY_DN2487_c3_g1_i2:474-836(-)
MAHVQAGKEKKNLKTNKEINQYYASQIASHLIVQTLPEQFGVFLGGKGDGLRTPLGIMVVGGALQRFLWGIRQYQQYLHKNIEIKYLNVRIKHYQIIMFIALKQYSQTPNKTPTMEFCQM